MSEKKKILIFIDWFLPGYKAGGPIRSVANITERLSAFYDFYIVTRDRDKGDTAPYNGIEQGIWVKKDQYTVMYLKSNLSYFKSIAKLLKQDFFDTVYFNSLFSSRYTLFPLLYAKLFSRNKKIILSPRGMLGQGALNLKSKKKFVFLKISRFFKLFENIKWHATDADEKDSIKKYFGKDADIAQISNISGFVDTSAAKPLKDPVRFVFLSRISKKKNLLYAIKLFEDMSFNKHVVFDIYGPAEEESYLKECKAAAGSEKINIEINFKPPVAGSEVIDILRKYHFFLLPTLHENYGHVIYEALAAGCPLLISTHTPWRDLKAKGIGYDIDLKNTKAFKEAIKEFVDCTEAQYKKMSGKSLDYAKHIAENTELINKYKKLFE